MNMYRKLYQILILAFALAVASCSNKSSESVTEELSNTPVPVTLAAVVSSDAIYYDEYPATINALDQINITPQVTGYITRVHFKDGQKVKQGQLLYSIDQQVYKANLQQAVSNLQLQEASMVKASKDADRYHELDKHDAVAKQQVDNAEAALEVSKKQVAAAKANVNSVRSNVSFSSIRAPLTGTIGISQVKEGTMVSAGQTILNTVSTDSPIAVDFTIGQKDIFRFTKMKNEGTDLKDSIFTISFNGEVYEHPGRISVIDRAVDPQTGTLKIRLVFPNGAGILKPGMNTTVRVKNVNGQQHTIIPYKAVSEQLGEFYVYLLKDSLKVSQRKIIPGRQIGTNIVVTEGLYAGDSIAVEGVQNLQQGSVITTGPVKDPNP